MATMRTNGVVVVIAATILVTAASSAASTIPTVPVTSVVTRTTSCRNSALRLIYVAAIRVLRRRRRQINWIVVTVVALSVERLRTTGVVFNSACVFSSPVQYGRARIRRGTIYLAVLRRFEGRWAVK